MTPLALGVTIALEPSLDESLSRVRGMGIPTIQISYPGSLDTTDGVALIKRSLANAGIEITSVICGFPGDRYDDIATVRATIGLVPEARRAERLEIVHQTAAFADKIGVKRIQAHIGYVPDDPTVSSYPGIVQAMRAACDDVARFDQAFALETGQETAAGLRYFIDEVNRPNLRVNFDPANMILYGNDNPIDALDILAPFIDGVHCKDGCWPTRAGQLGQEMPLGQGEVDFERWLRKLVNLGYRGPLTIEREISGEQQVQDILAAKTLIESIVQKAKA